VVCGQLTANPSGVMLRVIMAIIRRNSPRLL
jgi:hypothetical protein